MLCVALLTLLYILICVCVYVCTCMRYAYMYASMHVCVYARIFVMYAPASPRTQGLKIIVHFTSSKTKNQSKREEIQGAKPMRVCYRAGGRSPPTFSLRRS